MRVAMDIEVLRDSVSRYFLACRFRCLEENRFRKARVTIGPLGPREREPGGFNDFVSRFSFGKSALRCERNEAAEMQLNKKRGESPVNCSF
jgi:hypothetical protein